MQKFMKTKSPSSQADSPASHLVLPGSAEARQMTVSSGLKCLELSGRSNPPLLLARMFLVSSAWHSTRCSLTWKQKVTPQKRLLFQLSPSTRRTAGTGFGLLPTPTAVQRGRPEVAISQALKGEPLYKRRTKDGKGRQFSLMDVLIYRALLPTPKAQDSRAALTDRGKSNFGEVIHGLYHSKANGTLLNPAFVEEMMGFPIGWTELKVWETL